MSIVPNKTKSSIWKPQQATPKYNGSSPKAYTGQSTIDAPKYISESTTESAANNALAQGYAQADQRYQTKKTAKAGISQGAGQAYMGAQEGAQAMNKAAQQAADIRSQDQMVNAKMESDYEKLREQEAQHISMLQHGMNQSDWQRRFSLQSANAQLQMAQQQALLQLRLSMLR